MHSSREVFPRRPTGRALRSRGLESRGYTCKRRWKSARLARRPSLSLPLRATGIVQGTEDIKLQMKELRVLKKLHSKVSIQGPRHALLVGLIAAISLVQSAAAMDLEKALSSGDRSAEDKARDADRRPSEVVAFLGIRPGMTVVDLIAAGGYYTEVLSLAVGDSGKIYAQNPEFVLKFRDGANEKTLSARLEGNRLKNVERLDRENSDLGLKANSIDAALTALNFHDIANGGDADAAAAFLRVAKTFLKSGGVLGIVDHDGRPENDNAKLHRIPKSEVVKAAEAVGFELIAAGEMLRNPDDDLSGSVFAEGMRGKTDRFVLLFKKP